MRCRALLPVIQNGWDLVTADGHLSATSVISGGDGAFRPVSVAAWLMMTYEESLRGPRWPSVVSLAIRPARALAQTAGAS